MFFFIAYGHKSRSCVCNVRYEKTSPDPGYFEYKATLQPMKVHFRSEMPWGFHIGFLLCPSGACLSILSIATAQPPSMGIEIGLNRGGGLQAGLIPKPVVLSLTDAEIERVVLDSECDGSAGGKL